MNSEDNFPNGPISYVIFFILFFAAWWLAATVIEAFCRKVSKRFMDHHNERQR